jgi:hypothetical protein
MATVEFDEAELVLRVTRGQERIVLPLPVRVEPV